MPECQNCGEFVTDRYVAVFEPDGIDQPRVCPYCPDMVRKKGKPAEALSSRAAARTQNS